MKLHLTILAFLFNFILCRDFNIGTLKKDDVIMIRDSVYQEKRNFGYATTKYKKDVNCPITYVKVSNRLANTPPIVRVIDGGLQENYITLHLTSQRNEPISVAILIGCKNEVIYKTTTTTRTTTKPITTTTKLTTTITTTSTTTKPRTTITKLTTTTIQTSTPTKPRTPTTKISTTTTPRTSTTKTITTTKPRTSTTKTRTTTKPTTTTTIETPTSSRFSTIKTTTPRATTSTTAIATTTRIHLYLPVKYNHDPRSGNYLVQNMSLATQRGIATRLKGTFGRRDADRGAYLARSHCKRVDIIGDEDLPGSILGDPNFNHVRFSSNSKGLALFGMEIGIKGPRDGIMWFSESRDPSQNNVYYVDIVFGANKNSDIRIRRGYYSKDIEAVNYTSNILSPTEFSVFYVEIKDAILSVYMDGIVRPSRQLVSYGNEKHRTIQYYGFNSYEDAEVAFLYDC